MGNVNCCTKDNYCKKCPEIDLTQDCSKFISDSISRIKLPEACQNNDTRKLENETYYLDAQFESLDQYRKGNDFSLRLPKHESRFNSPCMSSREVYGESRYEYSMSEKRDSGRALNDSISNVFIKPTRNPRPRIWSPKRNNGHRDDSINDLINVDNSVIRVLDDDRNCQEQRFAKAEESAGDINASLIEYNCESRESFAPREKFRDTFQMILSSNNLETSPEQELKDTEVEHVTPRFTEDFSNRNFEAETRSQTPIKMNFQLHLREKLENEQREYKREEPLLQRQRPRNEQAQVMKSFRGI